jgi:hypothetical protein
MSEYVVVIIEIVNQHVSKYSKTLIFILILRINKNREADMIKIK